MNPSSSRGFARRSFLRSLCSLPALAIFPAAASRAVPAPSHVRGLDASDRALAALAVGLWREQPAAATRVFRAVEDEFPDTTRFFASKAHRARMARARLLRNERIAAELARGDVVLLDGWVLARSEGSLAIYLQGLAAD